MRFLAIKIILGIYLVLLCLDVITTVINGPLVRLLETNPLYKYLGVAGIVVLNLGLLVTFYYLYQLSSETWRFTFLLILTVLCIVRGIACWNNYMVYLSPPTLAQAAAVTSAMKVAAVKRFAWSGILMYVPGIIAYNLFRLDHKISIKD